MEVITTTQDHVTLVRLVGRLDTPASQEVNAAIAPVLGKADGNIILDC